jgi:hypothetical protein
MTAEARRVIFKLLFSLFVVLKPRRTGGVEPGRVRSPGWKGGVRGNPEVHLVQDLALNGDLGPFSENL